MGRAVYFYAIDKELNALLQFTQDTGLLALPPFVPTDEYDLGDLKAVPPVQFKDAEGGTIYLVPKDIPVVEVFYKPTIDPSESYILPHVSPVIEFGLSTHEENTVYQNRIYICAPLHELYSKPVYNAYNRIARYIKKWPKAGKAYIAPETYKLARNKKRSNYLASLWNKFFYYFFY